MSATKTKSKPTTVEEAVARRDETVNRLDDLTRRLESGDLSVTSDDLIKARADAEHAGLAVLGAQANAKRAVEEKLRRDATEVRKNGEARLDEAEAKVSERAEALEEAVRSFLDAVDAVGSARASVSADYENLRPRDISLDMLYDLLPWFKDYNPVSRYGGDGLRGPGMVLHVVSGVLWKRPGRRQEESKVLRDIEVPAVNNAHDQLKAILARAKRQGPPTGADA